MRTGRTFVRLQEGAGSAQILRIEGRTMSKGIVSSSLSRRQFLGFAAAGAAAAGLAGCGNSSSSSSSSSSESKTIDTLHVAFVPSKDPDQIITATDPLKQMLIDELSNQGYTVNDVDITVGTSYEAVGEGLTSGTIDVGFIPGGTYVLYSDGCEVLLTATRNGLSIDSDDPKDWNDQKPTTASDQQVTFYRALLIAGPSDAGKALGDKVNNGQELSWDDINGANWSVMSSSSPAGYIYPCLWLNDNYGKTVLDLTHAVQSDSYGSAFARLASGQVDALCVYADGRRDYESKWTSDYSRTASIWDETNVIGVTKPIYNDTISASKASKTMTDDFKKAFSQAMINIGNTDEGKKVIAIYSHNGYVEAQDSDYDSEREAQEMVKKLKSSSNS